MRAEADVIRIGIICFPPEPGRPKKNLKALKKAITGLSPYRPDLILLPELWATGLIKKAARNLTSQTASILKELKKMAQEGQTALVGTLPETLDTKRIYNTTFVTSSEGSIPVYRKIHLFAPMGEHRIFTPGREVKVRRLPLRSATLNAGFLTCFDLRFPELSRHLVYHGAQLLLVSALWPLARKEHLQTLTRARAIENQCLVALSNPHGRSGDLELAGCSCLMDPWGNPVSPLDRGNDWQVFDMELSLIEKFRTIFNTITPPGPWIHSPSNKVLPLQELLDRLAVRRKLGHKVVFTNGCFDLLHPGHVEYLEAARGFGDLLVVGLNSDRSIRGIKGPTRPVNTQEMRARVLSGLWAVDYVVIFDEPTPMNLISNIVPDILVKGADWEEDQIVGADLVKAAGGRVERVPFQHPTSTSKIIEKVVSLQKTESTF